MGAKTYAAALNHNLATPECKSPPFQNDGSKTGSSKGFTVINIQPIGHYKIWGNKHTPSEDFSRRGRVRGVKIRGFGGERTSPPARGHGSRKGMSAKQKGRTGQEKTSEC